MRNLLYFLFVFDLFSNQSQMVCYKVEIKHRICIFVCVFLLEIVSHYFYLHRKESQYNDTGSTVNS